jgi:hypothetical protein
MPDDNEVTPHVDSPVPKQKKSRPAPKKITSKSTSLKNLTLRVQDKSKGPAEPELFKVFIFGLPVTFCKAVVEVVHNLNSRLELLQYTTYSPKIISPNSMEELLIGIRILKEIRQVLYTIKLSLIYK